MTIVDSGNPENETCWIAAWQRMATINWAGVLISLVVVVITSKMLDCVSHLHF